MVAADLLMTVKFYVLTRALDFDDLNPVCFFHVAEATSVFYEKNLSSRTNVFFCSKMVSHMCWTWAQQALGLRSYRKDISYAYRSTTVTVTSFCLFSTNLFSFLVSQQRNVWLISLTVMCRTCNPEVTQGCRFDSTPGHCRVTTLGKLFTHMCLCHQAV